MAKIEDTGKVWLKGAFGTEYAVRVGSLVFVPGKGENDNIDCRVIGNTLVVDLHDAKKGQRILRCFSLELPPATPATLFNGFENTKHADVQVVTYKDPGVEEFKVAGDSYRTGAIAGMDFDSFYKWSTDFKANDGARD